MNVVPLSSVESTSMWPSCELTIRSAMVSVRHWRRGYSVLERPDSDMRDH